MVSAGLSERLPHQLVVAIAGGVALFGELLDDQVDVVVVIPVQDTASRRRDSDEEEQSGTHGWAFRAWGVGRSMAPGAEQVQSPSHAPTPCICTSRQKP